MEKAENREYFRVEVRLPIEFRKISHDEYLNIESTIKYGSVKIIDNAKEMHFLKEIVSKDEQDKEQILAYIKIIDKKIDMILDLLYKSKNDSLYLSRYINVNISGAGIRFTTDVNLHDAEHVELKITLPIPPYPKIVLLCDVVRSDVCDIDGIDNWETALAFKTINEDDRDLLINFIFTKEREVLRYKKEQSG
ncbi:MAG: PilZ domain-containing protein [Proteobacteria bacterium]|nr:PilZ domain-containing protein [Pseudomonadota bacterium]